MAYRKAGAGTKVKNGAPKPGVAKRFTQTGPTHQSSMTAIAARINKQTQFPVGKKMTNIKTG